MDIYGDISANDASFNNVYISGNVDIYGDISANDASFNNLNTSICNASNISTDIIDFQNLEFKRNNERLMRLFLDGNLTTLELKGKPGLGGSATRIRTYHQDGNYWDQESPVSEVRWKHNGGGSAFAITANRVYAHNYSGFSDDRLKHNEQTIQGLETIRQLNPQKYIKTTDPIRDDSGNILEDYVNQDISGEEQAGFIAQEILETDISYCVHQHEISQDFSPYSVDYNSVFTYAVQAIKELDITVQELKSKVNNLEAENVNLRTKLNTYIGDIY